MNETQVMKDIFGKLGQFILDKNAENNKAIEHDRKVVQSARAKAVENAKSREDMKSMWRLSNAEISLAMSQGKKQAYTELWDKFERLKDEYYKKVGK